MQFTYRRPKCEVPSVAMGDIAFNLLVFFVILARATDDSHVTWDPASAPKVVDAKFAKATVTISTDQVIYLNGKEVRGADLLEKQISDLLGTAQGEDRKVLLKVDANTPAEKFQPVIEAISKAGGEMWHILNQEDGKG